MASADPTPEEHAKIAESLQAERELKEWAPELLATVRIAYAKVDFEIAEKGKLDPEMAVQLWYQVRADFAVERRLRARMKPAKGAVRAIRERGASEGGAS